MINTRLIKMMEDTKLHVVKTVIWQWIALLLNIVFILSIVNYMNQLRLGTIDVKQTVYLLAVAAVTIGVRYACNMSANRESYHASVEVKSKLRDIIYKKVLSLGTSYTKEITTSELVQISVEGVEQLEIYFSKYLPQFFYSLLAPITLFVVVSFINFKVAICLLLCVPLIPISIIAVQKFAKKLLHKYWGIYTGLGDSFLDNLEGLVTLKIYQADERKNVEMNKEAEEFRRITMRVLTMQLNSISVMDLIAYGGSAVGIILAIYEYSKGAVGFAGVIAIILLSSEFFIPLRLLGSFFHIAMNGLAACKKIFRFLDLEERQEETLTELNEVGTIRLKDVVFGYEEERRILDQVSMEIEAGKLTSIVGESGSGKSTIASLLMAEHHINSGELSYGDHQHDTIKTSSLYKNITLVTHNGYLFKGTVEDNLKMAKKDASKEELLHVLDQVGLLAFLNNNQGIHTQLDEKASNLSGGQKQRLVLARALLHDTPMYIFDEATSNIDVESENKIMEVVHELAKTKTVLLISHRLENVKASDSIYVLEEGVVKQQGTHAQLMGVAGLYQRLVTTQQELEVYGREA